MDDLELNVPLLYYQVWWLTSPKIKQIIWHIFKKIVYSLCLPKIVLSIFFQNEIDYYCLLILLLLLSLAQDCLTNTRVLLALSLCLSVSLSLCLSLSHTLVPKSLLFRLKTESITRNGSGVSLNYFRFWGSRFLVNILIFGTKDFLINVS